MQIVRTIIWVLLFAGLLFFTYFNWQEVEVRIWTNMVLETKVPALVIVSFLLGLVPAWLLHRGTKWRLTRRIKLLEAAARMPQVAPAEPGFGQADGDVDSVSPITPAPNNPV